MELFAVLVVALTAGFVGALLGTHLAVSTIIRREKNRSK